ncbi:unnamed protein product [Enterobius vermicularis]|uniref:Secreted protein n=1 Tax=Enterobius vermicularis TaxID=51028 RepID=A0A0N4VDG4_ENTVE|nr:unnamed protein product [Enterobius vermicularis]
MRLFDHCRILTALSSLACVMPNKYFVYICVFACVACIMENERVKGETDYFAAYWSDIYITLFKSIGLHLPLKFSTQCCSEWALLN